MQIAEIKKGDVVTDGAQYFKVHKVNRVTVIVERENGYRLTAYPHVFKLKVDAALFRCGAVQ